MHHGKVQSMRGINGGMKIKNIIVGSVKRNEKVRFGKK